MWKAKACKPSLGGKGVLIIKFRNEGRPWGFDTMLEIKISSSPIETGYRTLFIGHYTMVSLGNKIKSEDIILP